MNRSAILVGVSAVLLAGLVTVAVFSLVTETGTLSQLGPAEPISNNGKPWRVGYYEGGFYQDYPVYLLAVIEGLVELGWIEPMDLPDPFTLTSDKVLWETLCRRTRSEYIQFVPSAYWSADWNEDQRARNRKDALETLRQGKLDFMIAMGTQAGLDLRDGHSVPTMVVSSTDPIRAGIIDSAEDSGRDHLHAACDPKRHYRQIRAFHNIVQFRRLGVIKGDSPQARVYAHLDDLERAAGEMGFALVVIRVREQGLSDAECRQEVAMALESVAPDIDALWISDMRGLDARYMPEILQPLMDHHVPTWTPTGAEQVQRGVMLGMPEEDLRQLGLFHARMMAATFHGAKPRDLPQVYESRRRILINRETARRIGFDLPSGLVEVADCVYDTIEGAPVEVEPEP